MPTIAHRADRDHSLARETSPCASAHPHDSQWLTAIWRPAQRVSYVSSELRLPMISFEFFRALTIMQNCTVRAHSLTIA
jgi:hypothetical protein